MSQQSDDSIERFFRKAVVQQDKTFMERDWASMEKMLDEQAMLTASQKKSGVRSIIATAIVISAITFLFVADDDKEILKDSVRMQAAVGVVGPLRGVTTEGPAADLHSSTTDCAQQEKVSRTSKTNPDLRSAKSNDKPRKIIYAAKRVANNKFTVAENGDSDRSAVAVSISEPESKPNVTDYPGRSVNNAPAIHETGVVDPLTTHQESVKVDSLLVHPKEEDTREAMIADEKSDEEKTSKSFPRFSITGLVSPDFSTTSLSKYSRPSNVFGLLIGYRVFNRITVMTGATKSLKRYEGYGQEYSPPEGYWRARTNGIVPDEVEGKCGIIEVPVLVQVDVLQRMKNRLFFSVGVSSYFMRSEYYQYTFKEPNPGAAESWTAKEPTRYLFKIGHLSAGYDHVIAKKFTLGIEPFLKVPFEGIGWTDINLYSAGAYVSVRYNILSRSNE